MIPEILLANNLGIEVDIGFKVDLKNCPLESRRPPAFDRGGGVPGGGLHRVNRPRNASGNKQRSRIIVDPPLAAIHGQAANSTAPGRVWAPTAEGGRQILHLVGDWLTSSVHQAKEICMEMQKNRLLVEKPSEKTDGWRVAAALQGPCFLVLVDLARNPPLLSAAPAFVSYG